MNIDISYLGPQAELNKFIEIESCSDGFFKTNQNGVTRIVTTLDKKVEYIFFDSMVLAYVKSAMGYPAYYPVHNVKIESPVRAVLMDLDGTSVKSEKFWIWIIEKTVASLLENPGFELKDSDIPHVSGHSVSEHLEYCIKKYCPTKTVEEARRFYFQHTNQEMQAIMKGCGRIDAFTPANGLKDFLLALKERGIKIGLVTSGLYEKAWPEIISAFRQLGLGDPRAFYDGIITAGFPIRNREPGTLGELSPKPHPWLYAEVARVGLGIPFGERYHVIGIEDSGAGVNAIRLAGFAVIGLSDGNIAESGTRGLCSHFCDNFEEILNVIDQYK